MHHRTAAVLASASVALLVLAGCATRAAAPASMGMLAQPAATVAPQPAAKAVKSYLSADAFDHCVNQFIAPYKSGDVLMQPPPASNDFERIVVKQVIATSSPSVAAAANADGSSKERDTLWDFKDVLGPKFTPDACPAISTFLNAGFDDAKRINTAIKKQFNRPRPGEEDPAHPKSNPSFPSGHATTAGLRYRLLAAVAGGSAETELALCRHAWFNCYERLAVNAHYPSDIAAGFALGEMVGDEILHAAAADPNGEAAKALQAAKLEWQSRK